MTQEEWDAEQARWQKLDRKYTLIDDLIEACLDAQANGVPLPEEIDAITLELGNILAGRPWCSP